MVLTSNLASYLAGCLFFITLSFGGGVNVGALLLAIFGLIFVWKTPKWLIDSDTKIQIFVFCFYFFVYLLSMLLDGDSMRVLDRPSRVLLAIPVLLTLLHYIPKVRIVNIGIIGGAVLAGIAGGIFYLWFSQYGRAFHGLPEAFGFWHQWAKGYMPIQSGDMAVSLGFFAFVVSLYSYRQKRYFASLVALLGFSMGLLASIFSGTRGGWICIPVLFFILLFLNRKNVKFFIGVVCLGILIVGISGQSVYKKVKGRLDSINTELVRTNSSSGARLELWKDAFYTFKEKPFLGVGLKARTEFRILHKKSGLISLPDSFDESHAHNQFLEVLSVKGLVGFSALLALFLWPLWVFIKRLKSAKELRDKERRKLECVCQLGICHILLVMGYCLTQAWLEHNSGITFYSVVLVVFFAMSSKNKITEKAFS